MHKRVTSRKTDIKMILNGNMLEEAKKFARIIFRETKVREETNLL